MVCPCKNTGVDREALLEKKLSELAKLQSEIDQMRTEIGAQPQILVRVEMLEVSLTKLRSTGVAPCELSDKSLSAVGVVNLEQLVSKDWKSDSPYTKPADYSPSTIVDWLEKNHFAKVLAKPTLVMINGRPASIFCGNEYPIQPTASTDSTVRLQKCGAELDILSTHKSDDQVRLEIRARISELDRAQSVVRADGSLPALSVCQCDTDLEATYGKPVILGGLFTTRSESIKSGQGGDDAPNEVALLMVVTAEQVQSITQVSDKAEGKTK